MPERDQGFLMIKEGSRLFNIESNAAALSTFRVPRVWGNPEGLTSSLAMLAADGACS
jgi:hypothetical protein